MAFFKSKKNDILDLSKNYRAPVKKEKVPEQLDLTKTSEQSNSFFPFFNSPTTNNSTPVNQTNEDSDSQEEKRKKLAKRLVDMTNRIEELDNKIYHLQQRIEVLEKKEGLSGFESNSNSFNGNGLAF
jgi:predicted  nucleic acid-binding Zn-ribbon protein